jgi:hypothetical protein
MKQTALLTMTSLILLVLSTIHLADDIVRGFEKGQLSNLTVIPLCLVWLYGAVMLADRPTGHVIVFLTSLLGMFVPYVHMSGRGVGLESRIAHTEGALLFVWTLLAMGAIGAFGVVLSARALWNDLRTRETRTA